MPAKPFPMIVARAHANAISGGGDRQSDRILKCQGSSGWRGHTIHTILARGGESEGGWRMRRINGPFTSFIQLRNVGRADFHLTMKK